MRREEFHSPEFARGEDQSILERRIRQIANHELNSYLNETPAQQVQSLRQYLNESMAAIFPEEQELREMVFKDIDKGDPQKFIDEFSERVAEKFGSKYPLQEIEQRIERRNVEERGYEPLNKLLMLQNNNTLVNLHIAAIFDTNPLELYRLMIDGLQKLSKKLQTEHGFANVREIKGRSWIVYKNPDLVKNLGFEVTEVDDKTKTAKAVITKASLIEKYGK